VWVRVNGKTRYILSGCRYVRRTKQDREIRDLREITKYRRIKYVINEVLQELSSL